MPPSMAAWSVLAATRQRPVDVALRFPVLEALTLVVGLLAPGHGQFHFHLAALEVHSRGYQREAFFRRLAGKLVDLAAVQQEFARPFRGMVQPVAEAILGDLRPMQPKFA